MPLPKQYNIKWNKQDFLTLGKVVSNFNRKINELNKEENKAYLPNILNYKEVKENITTRSELNRVLASLRRFSIKGAEELYTTKAGQNITKWEFGELQKQVGVAKRRLKLELSELNIPNEIGFSKAQMGSRRVREIEADLKSLENIEKKKGYDFDRLSRRIKTLGTSDYNLKKASVYQENIMNELDKLRQNIPEFNKLYEYFNNIKNPITFYNTVLKSNAMEDFFSWYQNPNDYAGFSSPEEIAEYIIEQYRDLEEIEEDTVTIINIKGSKKGRRRYALFINGEIETSSNDLTKIYNLYKSVKDRGEELYIVDLSKNTIIE